jgi:hypothetical protein
VGIVLMGIGFGLMLLIGLEEGPERGIGVGGFVLVLGLAFLISSFVDSPQRTVSHDRPSTSTPPVPHSTSPGSQPDRNS